MKTLAPLILLILLSFNSCAQPVSAVRGVWLTNVDSDVLLSRERIVESVELLDRLNFNTIFVVTWNKGYTLYPSATMKKHFGIEMDTLYTGRDPLKELIEEAHKRNMKVIAWFEFGFATSYNRDGGHIIAKYPEWKAMDRKGELLDKGNFEWMNAFLPEVQEFMLSLITEVVTNYDIDGIQGDDRLPALPVEGGYDPYTVELYKKAHNGNAPPNDFRDPDWIQWRADLLTKYSKDIYDKVKSIKKNVIVSMSPSIHPWAKEEYLQDWPAWVQQGSVELVIPQLYRYNIEAYKELLDEIVGKQVPQENMGKFFPGVLIKVGKYQPDEKFLRQMIELNRKAGINGEVFFFYEGLKKYGETFWKEIYKEKAKFPELLRK